MKKLLALVLAGVMALSLTTVVGAAALTPPDEGDPKVDVGDTELYYGDDELEFYLEKGDSTIAVGDDTDDGYDAFCNTDDYSLSVSVSSDNSDIKASYKLYKNPDRDGVAVKIIIDPISEKFTVADDADWEVKVKVVQKLKGQTDPAVGELLVEGTIGNTRAFHTDSFTDAYGSYILDTEARVIDVSVFEDAEGKALSVNYPKYAIKFNKVSRQNTSLYLYAKTDVVDVSNTKAIGSIAFKPTRVKDAATITMPISADNENYYGETVYVYNIVDGKPSGESIKADVVNHNYVVFSVPSGTTLGTFAAYGAKTDGDAEKPAPTKTTAKPAIPETGAGDIVNLTVVLAVVALAGAGLAAVKKVSK